MEKIVYDKKEIYDNYFCYKVPKCLSLYVYLDGFKAQHITLYAIICDYYNSDYGYAFPTIDQVSLIYGYSNKATSEHLRILEKYGLLDILRPQNGYNHFYVPLLPLDEAAFFEQYPEAKEKYDSVKQAKEREKERSFQSLAKHKGYKYKSAVILGASEGRKDT